VGFEGKQGLGDGRWRVRAARRLCWAAVVLAVGALGAQGERPAATLESLFQEAVTAFEEQRWTAARDLFQYLEDEFGAEPEYTAPSAQAVILPLHGYARLVTGDAEGAIDRFERFLAAHRGPSRREAFVLFALGQAFEAAGRRAEARETYRRFAERYRELPEAGVARLRIGESFVEDGMIEEALAAFDAFAASRFAVSLRLQARLRALQLAREHGLWEAAAGYLLDTPWELETLPEPALLAFAALEVGDFLLGEERFEEAIAAYRLVPDHAELLSRQAGILARLEADFARRASFAGAGGTAVWSDHSSRLLARLRALQSQLENSPDYTGARLLRYGQAFAGAGRHFEAWTVFAAASEDPALPSAERREAHYRWILEAQALARWAEALRLARGFVERYPDSPRAPVVLFLLANAHQRMGAYREAGAILDELLRDYPGHALRGRWLFARGFNHIVLERYAEARGDFAAYGAVEPEGPLALESRLWHALAWFFAKAYAPALAELDALLAITPEDHALRPETAYRRAAVLYAQRAYEAALAQLDAYLASHPEDRNVAEARVLRGDTLMGLGRLEEAVEAFAAVGPAAGALFPYAVFQVGKIHRAREDYPATAAHFRAYLGRTDLAPHPRRAEALSWVGWAYEQDGRPHEAVPLYLEALERHADDPAEHEVREILAALHRLHGRLRRDATTSEPGRRDAFLGSARFLDWLAIAREEALAAGRLTAYSRYRVHEAESLRAAGQAEEAEGILRQLGEEVARERLDSAALAAVGLAWQNAGRAEAGAFFEELLERYPQSPERVVAWYGLGRAAMESDEPARALVWLEPVRDWLTHPRAPAALLLYGEALLALGRGAEVPSAMEDLLRLRTARGRPHARALLLMARAADAEGDAGRAIPLFQRVYNLYRAYPELVGPAYVRSAELFEARGDFRAARETWREVLRVEGLEPPNLRARAQAEFRRLEALVPPEPEPAPERIVEATPEART
jgi:tetratricopeptide (TPR) repeat protein